MIFSASLQPLCSFYFICLYFFVIILPLNKQPSSNHFFICYSWLFHQLIQRIFLSAITTVFHLLCFSSGFLLMALPNFNDSLLLTLSLFNCSLCPIIFFIFTQLIVLVLLKHIFLYFSYFVSQTFVPFFFINHCSLYSSYFSFLQFFIVLPFQYFSIFFVAFLFPLS